MAVSDKDLILKAVENDQSAFQELVYRYDRTVLSIALKYSKDQDEAKDIYQEVFIRVFKGLKKFQFQSEFSTWLFRITTNVCLTYVSRKKSHSKLSEYENYQSENFDVMNREELIYDGFSPEEEAAGNDINEIVNAAVETLSPKQKMTFVLKHYEGYKIREISEMLGCKEGTVKKYLFDAVKNLRKKLGPVLAMQE
jgi:RNA polymerase sigma-70 factor (ECF subfamily)